MSRPYAPAPTDEGGRPGGSISERRAVATVPTPPTRRQRLVDKDRYGAVAAALLERGWSPIPLPLGKKYPPPDGYTGHHGRYPTAEDVDEWSESRPNDNVALRLPPDVIGFDVDAYHGGLDSLDKLEAEWGVLPPTVASTSRTDGSRIMLFKVPAGSSYSANPASGVDVIQSSHRYMLCAPSLHPEGWQYRWFDQAEPDEPMDLPPPPWELPELPLAWREGLASRSGDGSTDEPASSEQVRRFVAEHTAQSRPEGLKGVRAALDKARAAGAGRHDTLVSVACWAMREASAGYYPAGDAMGALKAWWCEVMDDTERRDGSEFGDAIRWAVGQVEADPERVAELRTKPRPAEDFSWLGDTQPEKDPPPQSAPEPKPAEPAFDIASRLVDGAAFVLDVPDKVPAVWGEGDDVAWASGESLEIVGPAGAGKTTLVGQLVAARLGLRSQVLGWPVVPGGRRTLYLASDRPNQISRALHRLFTEADRDTLRDKLRVWRGPPPRDLAMHPGVMVELAEAADADTVVLDSLKDLAIGLASDEVGAGLNSAIQRTLVEGVEVVALHHQRKGQGSKPNTLEDVFGSTWITAGAGSVVLLWGKPGDAVVELTHLKQPAGDLGPLQIEHDHLTGESTITRGFEPLRWLRLQPRGGTARACAGAWFETATPNDNQQKKARRKLDALVRAGSAHRTEGSRGGSGGSDPAVYRAVDRAHDTLDLGAK